MQQQHSRTMTRPAVISTEARPRPPIKHQQPVAISPNHQRRTNTYIVPNPLVRLHFMRLGLKPTEPQPSHFTWEDSQKNDHTVQSSDFSGQPEMVLPDAINKLAHFSPIVTTANPGYLYIINETHPDLWYEYKINADGRFSPVYWDRDDNNENGEYKDIRYASLQVDDEKVFKRDGSVLWAAYSVVQWSADYSQSLRTNAAKREQRMQKIICDPFNTAKANQDSSALLSKA